MGSRDADRAAEYAEERSIPRSHGSYEELLADDGVDAVYISTPNGLHAPWARAALEAGRHVLCEKPVDSDPEVVDGLFALAAERGLVFTEAFMWRHLPQTQAMCDLVAQGAVGELRMIRVWFGVHAGARGRSAARSRAAGRGAHGHRLLLRERRAAARPASRRQ